MSNPSVIRTHQAIKARASAALQKRHIAGIDIGSTRFSCAVARVRPEMLNRTGRGRDSDVFAALELEGAAEVPAVGVRQGVIVDVEAVAKALRNLVTQTRLESGVQVDGALFALSGGAPRTLQASASSEIPLRRVDDAAIGRVMARCRQEIAHRIRRPLHVEPLDFTHDGKPGVYDPRGSQARSLGVRFSLITVEREGLQALASAANAAGLKVHGVACAPAASGIACLTEDELTIGATLIDIGGEITGVANFKGDRLRSVHALPIGGDLLTADIAQALDIPFDEAEMMKCAQTAGIAADPSILGGAGPGEASNLLIGVIRPRVEEMFELVRATLPNDQNRPVVICGGGSLMPGIVAVGQAVLGRRVRLGRSIRTGGSKHAPSAQDHVTAHGLLAHAVRLNCDPWNDAMENALRGERAFSGLRAWLAEHW